MAADVMNLRDVGPETGLPMEPIRNYEDHYWTRDPSPQGDMNRCFIVLVGPTGDPDEWIALSGDHLDR